MKNQALAGWILAGLLVSGAALSLSAQAGPGRNGWGYGGPPQTAEERAARQAACLERNGGVCPNGGPRINCSGFGLGPGQGRGYGQCARIGLRDDAGPLEVNNSRPNLATPVQK